MEPLSGVFDVSLLADLGAETAFITMYLGKSWLINELHHLIAQTKNKTIISYIYESIIKFHDSYKLVSIRRHNNFFGCGTLNFGNRIHGPLDKIQAL